MANIRKDESRLGNEDTASRRALLERAGLLVVAGSAALLAGCEADARGDDAAVAIDEALTGNGSVIWCDSVTEQLTLSGSNGVICVRRGWSTPGDGGGGVFVWKTGTIGQSVDPLTFSGTTVTSGGGVIVVPRSGGGSWRRIFSGPLNVKWFGAKGDGSPAAAAIQACIAAASALPSVIRPSTFKAGTTAGAQSTPAPNFAVYIPSGLYRLEAGLVTGSNTYMYGDGPSSILFSPAVGSMPFHMVTIPTATDGIRIANIAFAGLNGINLETAKLDPSLYVQSEAFQSCAIHLQIPGEGSVLGSISNVVIERCSFSNLYGFLINGLDTLGDVHLRFSDNYGEYCGNGVNTCASNTIISNNILHSCEGIETSGSNILVSNNVLSGAHALIAVGGATAPPAPSNISIVGNVIDLTAANQEFAAENVAIGINGATDVSVQGNTILNPPQFGVTVLGTPHIPGPGINISQRISIAGNTIRTSIDRPGVSNLIYIDGGSEDISVVGNNIYGDYDKTPNGTIYGILAANAKRLTITSNIIVDCSHSGIELYQCETVHMSGNQISKHKFMGLFARLTTDLVLTGNCITQRRPEAVWDLYVDDTVEGIRLIGNVATTVRKPLNPDLFVVDL